MFTQRFPNKNTVYWHFVESLTNRLSSYRAKVQRQLFKCLAFFRQSVLSSDINTSSYLLSVIYKRIPLSSVNLQQFWKTVTVGIWFANLWFKAYWHLPSCPILIFVNGCLLLLNKNFEARHFCWLMYFIPIFIPPPSSFIQVRKQRRLFIYMAQKQIRQLIIRFP